MGSLKEKSQNIVDSYLFSLFKAIIMVYSIVKIKKRVNLNMLILLYIQPKFMYSSFKFIQHMWVETDRSNHDTEVGDLFFSTSI